MKSYIAKAQVVERIWYVVDAAGKPLGSVARQVDS
ncbi:50S ribosomal protein L13, partial [Clostridium perfringens]